jgi:glyoxylase-like metal-dependent hydrolase (beta-lactamase superfamily II)
MITFESENSQKNSPVRVHSIQAGMSRAYLIEDEAGLMLVDAGSPGHEQKILDVMHTLGRTDLKLIVITHAHFDHYGSAAALRRITGAPIAIHAADSEAMAQGRTPLGSVRSWGIFGKLLLPLGEQIWPPENTPADLVFEDGYRFDEFGIDAVAIHTPGHTPGSSTVLIENTLAYVGDLISSRPWLFAQRYYADDWSQIPTSVARLIELNPAWIFPGHGRPVRGERLLKLQIPVYR